ncbi:MAG: hypothetical protein GX585_02680 [Clostridiales bacterium]|nr:hypothetical protein [Clostridiales bacterium]
MTDCERAFVLLNARLDGEATPEDCAALKAHLRTCEACCQVADQLEGMQGAMADCLSPPPPGFADAVMRRVAETESALAEAAPPPRKRSWRAWYGLAAAVVLLLAGVRFLPMLGYGGHSMADHASVLADNGREETEESMPRGEAPSAGEACPFDSEVQKNTAAADGYDAVGGEGGQEQGADRTQGPDAVPERGGGEPPQMGTMMMTVQEAPDDLQAAARTLLEARYPEETLSAQALLDENGQVTGFAVSDASGPLPDTVLYQGETEDGTAFVFWLYTETEEPCEIWHVSVSDGTVTRG